MVKRERNEKEKEKKKRKKKNLPWFFLFKLLLLNQSLIQGRHSFDINNVYNGIMNAWMKLIQHWHGPSLNWLLRCVEAMSSKIILMMPKNQELSKFQRIKSKKASRIKFQRIKIKE